MGLQPKYDDEFRASAVLMLEAAGYPDTEGSLARVSERLNVPARTLSRWARGEQNPPPDRVVKRKKVDLQKAIRAELAAIFAQMDEARADASYKDLTIAAGILIDKQQLIEGKPTQRIDAPVTHAREKLAHLVDQYASRTSEGEGLIEPN